MAQKQKMKFESFLDGQCSVWHLDEKRMPKKMLDNIRFQNRVVGYKRNFCAEQADYRIEKLIRIPRVDNITRGAFVVIGKEQYSVIQAQPIFDTIPKCTDLTLAQPELMLDFDATQAGPGGRL